jgi:hypothetical protein
MKTTRKTVARLLPLLAILAVLPFAVWSCEDAGDEPDGPTGPFSQYNPEMDTPGAKIKVSVKGETFPGGEFDLMASFTDGDGKPVPGVPLTAQAETGTGNVAKYFTFDVNPSITSAQGKASIHVKIAADCPEGSYRFVVYSAPGGAGPVNGPYARGFAGVTVSGVGTAGNSRAASSSRSTKWRCFALRRIPRQTFTVILLTQVETLESPRKLESPR